MKARIRAYILLGLVAFILALLPAALFADMVMPLQDGWQASRAWRFELVVYKALALPPGWIARIVTNWPTAYAGVFLSPSRELAGTPPRMFMLEHIAWAFPLWFAVLALLREVFVAIQARGR